MSNVDKGKPQTQREHTDKSLRRERDQTDEALELKRKAAQEMADDLVECARDTADEVLNAAREKVDQKLHSSDSGEGVSASSMETVLQGRIEEDLALREERDSADESIRLERAEEARILAALLPLERQKTDRNLLIERELSDDAVAHRDDFMGMVSHDLRNLLSGIAINAKLASRRAGDSDEGRQTVAGMDRIERYVARMSRLIGDLVDVVSIDAGKLAVHPHPADLNELISEAIHTFAPVAQDKGVTLASFNHQNAMPATFDSVRMLQVLANLITNAIRFTPSGGSITIEAVSTGSDFQVSVFDTGEGIATALREEIFERFKQAGGNKHQGLGLGLYISRRIVTAQGGRIWVENNPTGRGSVFHFTIPASGDRG